jgi:hypothetical protein
MRQHHPRLLPREIIPVESFPATVQRVKAGFGDGLAFQAFRERLIVAATAYFTRTPHVP